LSCASCLQWETVDSCSDSFQPIVQDVWVSALVFQIGLGCGAVALCLLGRFV